MPAGAVEEANFVANMKRLRESHGWSQGELAKRMKVAGWDKFHQTTISRIEQGVQPVRLGEARGIADALGATVDQMVLDDMVAERWRQLRALVVDLHLHGIGIGNAVLAYVDHQERVEPLIDAQPPFPDGTPESTLKEREQTIEAARYEASIPYWWHANNAFVPENRDVPYDPDAPTAPFKVVISPGSFEFFEEGAGGYRYRLRLDESSVVVSDAVFSSKSEAVRAADELMEAIDSLGFVSGIDDAEA